MFEIFSTREVASSIYLIIRFVWLISKKDGTKKLIALLKTVFKAIFIVPVLCLSGYAALLVYGLQFLPFWDWILLKDVILWVLFVATPICFRAGTRKNKDYPFRKMIADNFLGSAVLEFFIGAFTFSFITEIVILPIFTVITILKDYDSKNPKHKPYQKFYDGIAAVAGLILIIFTIKEAVTTITTDGIITLLMSFFIPVIFSVAYLPVVYMLAVTAKYNDLFVRFYIRNNFSKDGLSRKKKCVFCVCGISYKKIQKFEQAYYHQYITTICSANDDNSFFEFVENLKKN